MTAEPEAIHDRRDVVGTLAPSVVLTAMTADEARATVERIKGNLENIRADLFMFRDGEGWKALGYETLQECMQQEFGMSPRRAHQLLNAHAVDRILAPSWQESTAFFGKNANEIPGGTTVPPGMDVALIPERHARELEPLVADEEAVREVHAEVMQATGGKPKAADYRAAVDRFLGAEPTERQATVLQAIEHASPILEEPEAEKALYALSRVKFWVHLSPRDVAEAAAEPAQDAAGYAELAGWVAAIAGYIEARASGLRVVR